MALGPTQAQKVRPSLADLQTEGFFEELESEADRLRNGESGSYVSDLAGSLPPLDPIRNPVSQGPGRAPPTTRKSRFVSRFAQQREAELNSRAQPQVDIPKTSALDEFPQAPLGRFELNLETDEHPGESSKTGPKSNLIGEVFERVANARGAIDTDFTSHFQPTGFPKARKEGCINPISAAKDSFGFGSNPVVNHYSPKSCSSEGSSKPIKNMFSPDVKKQISLENESLLASMSADEILKEQAALKAQLAATNPLLLQSLLGKQPTVSSSSVAGNGLLPGLVSVAEQTTEGRQRKQASYDQNAGSMPPLAPPLIQTPKSLSPLHAQATAKSGSSCQLRPVTFDMNGKRASCGESSTSPQVDDDADIRMKSIHTHHMHLFTLKQLLQLTRSAVPPQRIIANKILTQVVKRYFDVPSTESSDNNGQALREVREAVPEMLQSASHAVQDKNLGVVITSLVLMHSILSNAQEAAVSHQGIESAFQSDWVDVVLSQSDILQDLFSHFQVGILPKPSLALIVQILQGFVKLGETSKVAEEIAALDGFLEVIVRTLVAVPWPPTSDSEPQLPDPDCLDLLKVLVKASRLCGRAILNRGLLTPTLRFIGLPVWSLTGDFPRGQHSVLLNDHHRVTLNEFMRRQFELMTLLARYGLGGGLCATLNSLLRSTTSGLRGRLESIVKRPAQLVKSSTMASELEMITAYLNLLRSWIECADDPHVTDPPHSINWSQVTDWDSDILDILELTVSDPPLTTDTFLLHGVTAACCDCIAVHLASSSRKRLSIAQAITRLDALLPQVKCATRTVVENFLTKPFSHLTPALVCDSRLVTSVAKLFVHLGQVQEANQQTPTLRLNHLESCLSKQSFSLACQLAFKFPELSTLPWALCTLASGKDVVMRQPWLLLCSLFLRNSDGVVVKMMLEAILNCCQEKAVSLLACVAEGRTTVPKLELRELMPIFEDYVIRSGSLTSVNYPLPQHIPGQNTQCDQPAFLLPSTWPLLALSLVGQSHLHSLAQPTKYLANVSIGALALAAVAHSTWEEMQGQMCDLSEIFEKLVSGWGSVWKSLLIGFTSMRSQVDLKPEAGGVSAEDPDLEERVQFLLVTRLLALSPLKTRRSTLRDEGTSRKSWKAQKNEESELLGLLSDNLRLFDSDLCCDPTHSVLVVPFLSMTNAIDFRYMIFKDYSHIVPHIKLSVADVRSIYHSEDASQAMTGFFEPVESDESLLRIYCQLLISKKVGLASHEFIKVYILHHVSCGIPNGPRKNVAATAPTSNVSSSTRLLQMLLAGGDDEVVNEVLGYEGYPGQIVGLSDLVSSRGDLQRIGQSRQWLKDFVENADHVQKLQRLGWLEKS